MSLPTPLEVFSGSMVARAREVTTELYVLICGAPATAVWGCTPDQTERLISLLDGVIQPVRLLECTAQVMQQQAQEISASDRSLFQKTMDVVDVCRRARAVPVGAQAPDPTCIALADAVEEVMTRMQEALLERFPGEAFPTE